MNEISSVSRSNLSAYKVGGAQQTAQDTAAGQTRANDQADFSVAAQLLSRINELPDIRTELVARVKAEIEAGTYESADKIDAAIDELAEDLA